MPGKQKIYVNGINAINGQYLLKPKTHQQLVSYITGEPDNAMLRWLKAFVDRITTPQYGQEIDLSDPAQAGWGILFHQDESQAVIQALDPLVRHRRALSGTDRTGRVLDYHTGETVAQWLARHGLTFGVKDPDKVPHYLLIIGSPEKIPFAFGHLLDVEYAVGRLDFPRPEDYTTYVSSLIAYETAAAPPNGREAVFFGTRHKFDTSTQTSADLLVGPLADGVPEKTGQAAQPGVAEDNHYTTQKTLGDGATKATLTRILAPESGVKPPAFLFSAGHGMGWPSGHPDQVSRQGALLCQDWPGLGQIGPAHYFTAADIPANARVHGLVAFFFACYGAGTPRDDRYVHVPNTPPPQIAAQPFLAALPKALLTHPNGGALAIIGHVDRAWSYSIETRAAGPQIDPFRNAIDRILCGQPVGYAMRDFNERYASLSTFLSNLLEEKSFRRDISDVDLVNCWIERNDAEGYLVIGDPAVHLREPDLVP